MKNILVIFISIIMISCGSNKTAHLETKDISANEAFSEELVQSQTIERSQLNADVFKAEHTDYIIKFKDKETNPLGLQPSGNPIHVYGVSKVEMKSVSNNLFTMHIVGSSEEKMQAFHKILKDQDIEYIEPDYAIYQDDVIVNDSLYPKQWSHKNVHSTQAWAISKGSSSIVVAVVDSGIDYTHPDLAKNIWTNTQEIINGKDDDGNGYIDDIRGWNFVNDNSNPITTPNSNHGTHVAGIIGAAANNSGIVGQSPNVQLMPLKFIDSTGAGKTSNAIRAINYAIEKKVFLISNSWGSPNNKSKALEDAIAKAERAGILFITSAGNGVKKGTAFIGVNLDATPWYPAAFANSNVITVAATGKADGIATFSNYGVRSVDIAAPGLSILSTITNGKYQILSGTSMAAPLVSGVAVLVKAANPELNAQQIKNILISTSEKITSLVGKVKSGGRVNAYQAVLAAKNKSNLIQAKN